ncbi:hypothetical protein CCZ01_07670 [Helicobacter monodelphidis]|uniref:hypothetical protein n=1 Tax=Helicobacter sp. 15-1451 TaxID=2004995 RepID=UPI000DCD6DB7|nr:hypothetical protein [Helicobacter sp. 15-1451]RAX56923.1 hypothetical protein CCZ01_07670 [Helicobacter sp. 15-1451]
MILKYAFYITCLVLPISAEWNIYYSLEAQGGISALNSYDYKNVAGDYGASMTLGGSTESFGLGANMLYMRSHNRLLENFSGANILFNFKQYALFAGGGATQKQHFSKTSGYYYEIGIRQQEPFSFSVSFRESIYDKSDFSANAPYPATKNHSLLIQFYIPIFHLSHKINN